MTNTIENKAKFFAQYWGQHILKATSIEGQFMVGKAFMGKIYPDQYIELTPLSRISDEDRKEVSGELASSIDEYGCEYTFSGLVEWGVYDADYLR